MNKQELIERRKKTPDPGYRDVRDEALRRLRGGRIWRDAERARVAIERASTQLAS